LVLLTRGYFARPDTLWSGICSRKPPTAAGRRPFILLLLHDFLVPFPSCLPQMADDIPGHSFQYFTHARDVQFIGPTTFSTVGGSVLYTHPRFAAGDDINLIDQTISRCSSVVPQTFIPSSIPYTMPITPVIEKPHHRTLFAWTERGRMSYGKSQTGCTIQQPHPHSRGLRWQWQVCYIIRGLPGRK
jgi:hypothetical protein